MTDPVQLTDEDSRLYLDSVESTFGSGIDYSTLVKIYGADQNNKITDLADAHETNVSTKFIDQQNPTLRMAMRRLPRLTNASINKVENHIQSVALHFMHYNFVRIHQSSRLTPAMAANVTNHVWEVEEILSLLPS